MHTHCTLALWWIHRHTRSSLGLNEKTAAETDSRNRRTRPSDSLSSTWLNTLTAVNSLQTTQSTNCHSQGLETLLLCSESLRSFFPKHNFEGDSNFCKWYTELGSPVKLQIMFFFLYTKHNCAIPDSWSHNLSCSMKYTYAWILYTSTYGERECATNIKNVGFLHFFLSFFQKAKKKKNRVLMDININTARFTINVPGIIECKKFLQF